MELYKGEEGEESEKEQHEDKVLPGFRFHPTEEELVGFYLRRKVEKEDLTFNHLIQDLDLYAYEPWDLPGLAGVGRGEGTSGREREWFFFVCRGRRQHNDGRANRITAAGYWKATGTDRPVYNHPSCQLIGFKKTLVFYKGRAPKGQKTDWIMNEYRLHPSNKENENVRLCRIYKKASWMRSFDRRPTIQVERRVKNEKVAFDSQTQTSNSHSHTEQQFVSSASAQAGTGTLMMEGATNSTTPKLALERHDANCHESESWWYSHDSSAFQHEHEHEAADDTSNSLGPLWDYLP